MQTIIENNILVLMSLQKFIKEELDATDWDGKYSIVLAGADELRTLGENIIDKEAKIPILAIYAGTETTDPLEIGSTYGRESQTFRIYIYAYGNNQLMSLAGFLKRKLRDTNFDIIDYRKQNQPSLSSASTEEVTFTPIYSWGAVSEAEKYQGFLTVEVDYPGEKLVT